MHAVYLSRGHACSAGASLSRECGMWGLVFPGICYMHAVDEERSRRLGRGLPYAMGDDPRDGPGLPLTLIAQMRDVGEMATVIGFDGPKLGVRLPRAQRTREIRSLLLEALQKPVDHWARCPPDLKAGLQKVIEELGEELLATAESFLAAPAGGPGAARTTQRSS